ncbi:sensor domain-containing diguanylate cyclase [Fusibacter paucivorans]|uniref:Sensor domain-containing diguanylate cyclase n=1 Tax=Fusibacter paucivorans TaxID=76009 RepID=A0ABS5PTP6_9FIRM|nr:sensor domain-containing diguanylate cyclase [Fusibacter paucivorans]
MRIVRHENYFVVFYVDDDQIETLVKSVMMHRIRRDVLVDNGYIWIDQILNYDGGDDYAIRLVHPNMPETEGILLSTHYVDIKGNQPYLTELQGIIKDGELYQEYYFKKKDSFEVAHKLSYTRLYKPYDWVIATGVYLDDIDVLVSNETRAMKLTQRAFILKTLLMISVCLILASALIYLFEKRISRLIQDFQDEVTLKNEELQIEKSKIEEIAYKDSLTGLLTRRAMQDHLERANTNAIEQNTHYAIGIGDIDYFKKINDQYGHQAGDYVLVALANLFNAHLGPDYLVARWGGEEFLFLLNNTRAEEALNTMNYLRECIQTADFEYEGHKISVHISIGVTGSSTEEKTAYAILNEADKNLYIAKTTGRNKVVG